MCQYVIKITESELYYELVILWLTMYICLTEINFLSLYLKFEMS